MAQEPTFEFSQVTVGSLWNGSKRQHEVYEVDKCIFVSGNFSRVYIVTSRETNKKFAMKMMKRTEDNIAEASLLLGLNSARLLYPLHICRLHDIVDIEEHCNYGMIIDKGACSLLDAMQAPLHERHVKRIIYQLLLALETLHDIGIVHVDVKPENVLFKQSTRFFVRRVNEENHVELLNPVIMLCDFNCSKYLPHFQANDLEVFQTFHYRAPEVSLGLDLSASIDIFSVGAMMVEMMTAEVVFDMDEKDERDPPIQLRKKHIILMEKEMGECPNETIRQSRFPEFHPVHWRADAPRLPAEQSAYSEWRRAKTASREQADRDLLEILDAMMAWPTRRLAPARLQRMAFFRNQVVDDSRDPYYDGMIEIDPVHLLTEPILPELVQDSEEENEPLMDDAADEQDNSGEDSQSEGSQVEMEAMDQM